MTNSSNGNKLRTGQIAEHNGEDRHMMGGLKARPYYIPILIIALLSAGFGMSLLFQDQSPIVTAVTPRVGNPGEVMVIDGNFFGNDRTSAWVSISGQRVTSSSILEWTSQRISLRIPDQVRSGSLIVQTSAGRSMAQSFTNQNQIPHTVQAVKSNIRAFLTGISPAICSPGDPIILSGHNFGRATGSLSVLVDDIPLDPADIFSWDNASIGFWLPMSAHKGLVRLKDKTADSNTIALSLKKGSASLEAGTDLTRYQLEMSYDIGDVELAKSPKWGTISAYLPVPPTMLEQVVHQQKSSGAEAISVSPGMLSFTIRQPEAETRYRLLASWLVERKSTKLVVQSDPEIGYENYKDLQIRYAQPSHLVPSNEASVITFARKSIGAEWRPLTRARLIFSTVIDALAFDNEAGLAFAPEVLADRKAKSFGYANLYVGALRAVGIPARLIEGVLAGESSTAIPHYWAEFFIPSVGWIQADPAIADGLAPEIVPKGVTARTWYFGNIDNRHITFIRGEGQTSLTRLDSNIQKLFQRFVLMQVHAEASGNVESYGLFIDNPLVRTIR